MGGYRDLTTEETIKVRRILAQRCGLVLTQSGVYLLDGEEFCEEGDWQPDFCADHAQMVDVAMLVISEVLMQQTDFDAKKKQYRYSGVIAYEKPYVRTEWEDSIAAAIFDGAVRALQMEGSV